MDGDQVCLSCYLGESREALFSTLSQPHGVPGHEGQISCRGQRAGQNRGGHKRACEKSFQPLTPSVGTSTYTEVKECPLSRAMVCLLIELGVVLPEFLDERLSGLAHDNA
ncbi:hypothetical protein D3C76_1474340 [compost metagenome]